MNDETQIEAPALKRYQSSRIVGAGRILKAYPCDDNPSELITLEVDSGDAVPCVKIVDQEWIDKPLSGSNPVDGYFIEYDDGYTSWCPAESFESGYSIYNESQAEPMRA